jgi:hypothetical protein
VMASSLHIANCLLPIDFAALFLPIILYYQPPWNNCLL